MSTTAPVCLCGRLDFPHICRDLQWMAYDRLFAAIPVTDVVQGRRTIEFVFLGELAEPSAR